MTTKPSNQRYSALKKVGSGEFATTFSAHDNRLNRDVAIKQLHSQYMEDESRLSKYWREAQLLASLEHPNNMTIYDVDRARGRLVLELMQGSLRQIYSERPMPVEDVRQTLIQALKGLACLHDNGIIHGDINPNNLFLSRQDVVKLGDFGLARRVSDDEGSLLKGTTRFIAPELVSEEFGQVGPMSDLYSLGFSALDLLVGPEFESLFPDLIAFGRDRKMAWMMWHCSADRKLPPVQSMLEGVPADLAHVITKLTTKDQARRYKTANEALQELSANPVPVGKSLKEEAAAKAELARKQLLKRRRRAIAACVASVLASGAIYWSTLDPPAPPERKVPQPIIGVVQNVLPIDNKLVLDLGADWKEVKVTGNDIVTLNRKQRQLRDLQLDDRITVHTRLDPENKTHLDVIAFRPETHLGVIDRVDLEKKSISLKVSEGVDANAEFSMVVPDGTPVEINKLSDERGTPYSVSSLVAGDRVIVRHSDDEAGMLALSVEALRDMELSGFVRELDLKKRIVTIALSETEENADSYVRIPLATECAFTLNEQTSLNNRLIGLGDLRAGDRVTVKHDAKAKGIAAYRVFSDQGTIASLDYEAGKLHVTTANSGSAIWRIDPECAIVLAGKTVTVDDLRIGDFLDVVHDSPGDAEPKLDRINAIRPADKNKFAILIGNQFFDDATISPLTNQGENIRALHAVMSERYAIPDNQILMCPDFNRIRLEQEIPPWLSMIPEGAEVYVYLGTRAVLASNNNVYLATKDSVLEKIDQSGMRLDWLIDQLDGISTGKKILLLDCTHADETGAIAPVAPAEMIEKVRALHRGGYPRSLYVLGSCRSGETCIASPANPRIGLFAATIVNGFSGGADAPRDNRIEVTELIEFVENRMQAAAASASTRQLPVVFLPDATPPRISEAARQAVNSLLAHFEDKNFDREAFFEEAAAATELSGGQPDPQLALGIVLIQHARTSEAMEVLEAVRLKNPEQLLAHQAVIWLHFNKNHYGTGFAKLEILLKRLLNLRNSSGDYAPPELAIFEWAGQLREFAGSVDWSPRVPSARELQVYDEAIAGYGESAVKSHARGREKVRKTMAMYDADLESDPEGLAALVRQRFRNYVDPIADQSAVASIRMGLDK